MAKLIFGCGYLGMRVAQRWLAEGEAVYAVTRSAERADEFRRLGLRPLLADVTAPRTLADLPSAATVLYAIGYDRSAGKSMREVYVTGLGHVLASLPAQTGRIVYISSTGVYGQSSGEWVTEDSPCQPTREGGRACLEAEKALQTHALGQIAVILRLGGIYGPGRVPRLGELRQGQPIAAPEQGYLNLIHVDDAASIVLAAEKLAATPALINVSDGRPVLRGDYFRELARLIHAPSPQFAPPAAGDPAAQRAASDKRVDNRKMLAELGARLQFPSYREGLAAILAGE